MDMDLNARSAKWKREQEKQKERARRQLQTEALKRAAAERAREEMEKIQTAKRLERIQEQERLEQQALEEQRVTGGIKYNKTLTPVPTTSDGDKIALPVSALEELNPQHAFDLGVFTFELSFVDSNEVRKTHAGVLEFVADEGTVGLPPKVAASLFGSSNGSIPAAIQVKYVRLEKGVFASLQPKGDGFGDREIDFKLLLERSLKAHTTLTVGDSLFVRHGKQTFEVAVAELKPENAVNILNTDLEVAVLPSEAIMKAKEAEQRRAEAAKRAEERVQEKIREKEEKLKNLEQEPPVEERFQAKVLLRMPDGTQVTRRVAHASALCVVFALIEATTGDAARGFQLVATYPRRVFGVDASDKTLKELGLNGRQESLFVERLDVALDDPATIGAAADAADVDVEMKETTSGGVRLAAQWEEAKRVLEQTLDEALQNTNMATPIHALEPIMPPVQETADQNTKWHAQLQELNNMGFTNRELNIQILERYQGRLLRVVNYLSELTAPAATEHASPVVEPMQE